MAHRAPGSLGPARDVAIANGELKDIENRGRPTKYRGRVLIHAAKGMTRAEYEDGQDPLGLSGGLTIELPPIDQLKRGGIVGVTTIDACVSPANRTSLWHMGSAYSFHLIDTKPLQFIPCKGSFGFFSVPADVADQLRRMCDLGTIA